MSSLSAAVVSEWLRSQTRNLMGYARTGSNPVACETFLETGLFGTDMLCHNN